MQIYKLLLLSPKNVFVYVLAYSERFIKIC